MIVLDVSAAFAMVQKTAEGAAMRMLFLEGEEAIAPRFFAVEAANAASRYARGLQLTEEGSLLLFDRAVDLVDRFVDDSPLLREALHEAVRNQHSVYDMLYLVLARRNAATLFTLDKKLCSICIANGVNCIEATKL